MRKYNTGSVSGVEARNAPSEVESAEDWQIQMDENGMEMGKRGSFMTWSGRAPPAI